jgi:hypothetical protein
MIDPATLTPSDVGRRVLYMDYGRCEEGTLSSWTASTVFVKFKGATGEACNPEDVEFLTETS